MKPLLVMLVSTLFALSSFVNASEVEISPEWGLQLDEDNVQVFTRISDVKIDGAVMTQLEYRAITSSSRAPEILVSVINNVDNFPSLFSADSAEKIKSSEGLEGDYVYYYFDNPWPIPNLDLVRHISKALILENGDVQIKHTATPGAYEDKDVKRLEISDLIYTLKVKEDKSTELEIEGRFIPMGIPLMLVKAWLPDGPKEIALKIIKYAEDS
jgi:hypothetical protein